MLNASEGSPLLHEEMEGNNRTVLVRLNAADILLNPAVWVLLIDFFTVCGCGVRV